MIRKELKVFSEMMEYKLKKNDHKGNFENQDIGYLLKRLEEEVAELRSAIKSESYFEVMLEAADVANFACIIVWNVLRTQVVLEDSRIRTMESIPDQPHCDCNVIKEGSDEETHAFHCAKREWYRQHCTCSSRGDMDKTHTLMCSVAIEKEYKGGKHVES